MIVKFTNEQQLFHELEASAAEIIDGVVRFRVDRTPEQPEAVTFAIGVWITARHQLSDGSSEIFEFGGELGSDDDQDRAADKANAIERELKQVCEQNRLELRGGKIEM